MKPICQRRIGLTVQILLAFVLSTVPLAVCGCGKGKQPTSEKEQAITYVMERMHTLTWTGYNGASDPDKVRYFVDGVEVQSLSDDYAGIISGKTYLQAEREFLLEDLEKHPGRQRTLSLAAHIAALPKGGYLLIYPSYLIGREPYGLDRSYPWNEWSVNRVKIEEIARSREIQVIYGKPARAIHSPNEGLAYRRKHLMATDPTTPADELRKLANEEDREVRALVACNARATADILRKLASDTDMAVKANVAANVNSPGDALRKLANDDPYLRRAVVGNPNTPADLLGELVRDSDESMSGRAKERLEGLGDGP